MSSPVGADPTRRFAALRPFLSIPDGRLAPAPLDTEPAPPGSSPTQALVSPSMRLAFDAQFFAGLLQIIPHRAQRHADN